MTKFFFAIILSLGSLLFFNAALAEDGYRLWLRYDQIQHKGTLEMYKAGLKNAYIFGESATILAARRELANALSGLLGTKFDCNKALPGASFLICGTPAQSELIKNMRDRLGLDKTGKEGFSISTQLVNGKKRIILAANTDIGILYGVFHFLRQLQTEKSLTEINIVTSPRLTLRMLNHWDNLDRTVERGYAGFSIWDWHKLPGYLDKRYVDYARANASIGINGVALTNVNANALVLTDTYLQKVRALADLFRPYGLKVFLTARFSAPIETGGLKTADPLAPEVKEWWIKKAREIYALIPDFGGFVVKANSEGQPGPQNYGRNHADGANMLADAVMPFKGIVIWRAFVYSNENPEDRHKQAFNEFVPLDGKFHANVMVQVKNGAIDFQPREPFHPLFGAMPKTPIMMEFQLTQEYLGQATSLVYMAPLFKECLMSDTYSNGKGSTVAKVIDGSLDHHSLNGITGVANIGNDINWCGHPFAQANWYALGRLAWDYDLSSEEIADEWLRMTWSNDSVFLKTASGIMLRSREILVRYMTPLGLHHIMNTGHHYGPAPWVNNLSRPEWNPVYYHKADSIGIGFNRTSSGSGALLQYFPEARKRWEDMQTCDEINLLWFHHVPWTFRMKSGRSLWNEICFQYYSGADSVLWMQRQWNSIKNTIDEDRYQQVRMLLGVQHDEAIWWRNACLLYFQTFSRMPIPAEYPSIEKSLSYYQQLTFPFAPGWSH